MRMQTPSDAQAAEFRILKIVWPSWPSEIGLGLKLLATTRGRRPVCSTAGFWARISAAIRGPTDTKKEFRTSAETSGWTLGPSFFPATTDLILFHTLLGPRSLISLCSSPRRSRRTAARTERLRSLYTADFRPNRRRAARRCSMIFWVAGVTGGAEGFRMVIFFKGAWSSKTGTNSVRKASHWSLTFVALNTPSQSADIRSNIRASTSMRLKERDWMTVGFLRCFGTLIDT